MNIGHTSPDWGMQGWYDREEAKAYDHQEANYELHKADCMALAVKIAPAYINAADSEPLDTETWREWLADAAAWESQAVSEAMIWAIMQDEDFTLAAAIKSLHDSRKSK